MSRDPALLKELIENPLSKNPFFVQNMAMSQFNTTGIEGIEPGKFCVERWSHR